ncbi:hypothetical protein [Pedobacter suwonensis]|uniref:hypothetical protein n=1 Tax=Pedobacter suwonensis TaxID=332999 RepID=UPI00381F8A98
MKRCIGFPAPVEALPCSNEARGSEAKNGMKFMALHGLCAPNQILYFSALSIAALRLLVLHFLCYYCQLFFGEVISFCKAEVFHQISFQPEKRL